MLSIKKNTNVIKKNTNVMSAKQNTDVLLLYKIQMISVKQNTEAVSQAKYRQADS